MSRRNEWQVTQGEAVARCKKKRLRAMLSPFKVEDPASSKPGPSIICDSGKWYCVVIQKKKRVVAEITN